MDYQNLEKGFESRGGATATMSGLQRSFLALALLMLWLYFWRVITEAAHHPGYGIDPASYPYPWEGVFTMWSLFGIECLGFYLLLRRGRRLPLAFGLALSLLLAATASTPTCMPRLVYVPMQFHFFLTLLIGAAWALRAGSPEPGTSCRIG